MTGGSETAVQQAERHVWEAAERVERFRGIVAELERDNHPHAAAMARALLATYARALGRSRDHPARRRAALAPTEPD